MNSITLFHPTINGREVTFRWQSDPPTKLYHQSQFTLRFHATVDLTRVPESLWWTIMLICLHSQWPLLRPCRVRLPVRLRPGEAECWNRLMDAEVATLETYRGTNDFARQIEIIEDGPPLNYAPLLVETTRCATAFSGGKDSLVQTGLLTELTANPVLVATTSPMPPLEDHLTPRRRQILGEIERRCAATLIEVESDYRANFDHGFAQDLGYIISVNELTDTFLYTSALLAAGTAAGANHLFLAAETQVHENIERDGRVVQHKHFMYSAITQGALNAILRPYGISYGSLISPLHSFQVQELLWKRYERLCDLQYSCWRTKVGEWMCSRCSQCLRVALGVLALGGDATRIGVDWACLLNEMRDWRPKTLEALPATALPTELIAQQLHAQIVRDLEQVSWQDIARAIARQSPGSLLAPRGWRAVTAYRKLQRETRVHKVGPRPGYRAGFLKLVDPLLRDAVAAIFDEHFAPADEASYAGVVARSEALIKWITEPLNVQRAVSPL
jgi:hypothetical protein